MVNLKILMLLCFGLVAFACAVKPSVNQFSKSVSDPDNSIYFYGDAVTENVKEGDYPVLIFINSHYQCTGVIKVKKIQKVVRPLVSKLQLNIAGIATVDSMKPVISDLRNYYPGGSFKVNRLLVSAYFILPEKVVSKERTCLSTLYSLKEVNSYTM